MCVYAKHQRRNKLTNECPGATNSNRTSRLLFPNAHEIHFSDVFSPWQQTGKIKLWSQMFFLCFYPQRDSHFTAEAIIPLPMRSWGGSQLIDRSLEADWESQQQPTSDRVDLLSLPSPRWATLHASLRMLGVLMRVTGRLQAHFYCILISDRTSSASSSHVWAPNGSTASSASSLCSAEISVLG